MRVFRSAIAAGRWTPGAVVAIGKFDAMHRGHQRLIRLAVRRARELKRASIVLTFDPSPERFLGVDGISPILSLDHKLRLLAKLGVESAVLLPFNKQLACMAPEAFARDILAAQLKAVGLYVGEDFCFGKERSGRVKTLEELGPDLGFMVHPVPLLKIRGQKISASAIRQLLQEGRRKEAERLLGWKLNGGPF